MTEKEAISMLEQGDKNANDADCTYEEYLEAIEMGRKALEEIQQYRAMEQRLQKVYGECEGLLETVVQHLENHENIELPDNIIKARLLTDEDVDKWEVYRAIGTVEELQALKEKNEPKKILYRKQSYGTPWLCPYCEADQIKVEFFSEDGSEPKEKYTFCWQCGTRIDWSE